MINKKDLPSFMRIKHLKQAHVDGYLHFITRDGEPIGFYELNELNQFKNLFIAPEYRRRGIASQVIKIEMARQRITIATTKRMCGIKRLIIKLGFTNTGVLVQGKQSPLEIWISNNADWKSLDN